MYHYEKALKASDIVWSVSIIAVVWSSVVISVTWVELLWSVYKFFRRNNTDLKCSFVRCRKYHGAAELHISVDLLCGTTAAELLPCEQRPFDLPSPFLFPTYLGRSKGLCSQGTELHNSVDLLCGTTAAGLHNSVDLLCGTTAAETFERWTFWEIQQTQIDSTPSGKSWNMYAFRRFTKLLKDKRFTKTE